MTDRYAVIGHPVDHSRSPEIHAAFADQTGESLVYDRLPAAEDAFTPTVTAFFDDGGSGLNVTLPFKQEAARFADDLTPRARRAGAVNTLARRDASRVLGDNTDGIGLRRDIEHGLGIDLSNRRVLILGAGGAVRGVVPMLLERGPARLCIANRSPEKAMRIATDFADLGRIDGYALDTIEPGWDVVINAISAGLTGAMPTLADELLAGVDAVYDMIYADRPTPFLGWAKSCGVTRRRDGFGMLVEQAAASFYLWRDVWPDAAPVIRDLRPGGARYVP